MLRQTTRNLHVPNYTPLRLPIFQVPTHQRIHRRTRNDAPLHDRHDNLRRHRRRGRGGGLRGPLLRVRAEQEPGRANRHNRAVSEPRRRRMARRAALLRHGGAQARPPLPGRARCCLRRAGGLRGDQARGAVHLHHHEQAPGTPQREALQRRGGGGLDREGREGCRSGHELGSGFYEPRHTVLHGPQRDGG